MSIELVDKIDQAQKSNRRYQKVGGLNDLFLQDEEASVASTSGDDYIGLELETVMEKQEKKRAVRFFLIFISLSALIGTAVFFHRNSNTTNAAPSKGHGTGAQDEDDNLFSGEALDGDLPDITNKENDDDDDVDETLQDETEDVLWPTAAPLPKFDICKPRMHFKHHSRRIHHMTDIVIVPEDGDTDKWEYTFSALDIDEQASIIAVGLSDFSESTDNYIGMVRVFGFSCTVKKFKQLGQDLLGHKTGDQFGNAISSSKDGKVMAVAAPQEDEDGLNGYVQVYYLDGNIWKKLGQRIEELEDSEEYYNLGSAIDLSDNGETLAVLSIISATKFVTRVFDYDSNEAQWVRKGHDLTVDVDANDEYDFNPQISLSEAGDELSMLDPKVGLIKYHFEFETDKWILGKETRMPNFDDALDVYSFLGENVAFDESGDVVAMSAYQYGQDGKDSQQVAKIVTFQNNSATEIYNKTIPDVQVGIRTAVSNDGMVAAVVASRYDMDDNSYWEYDDVGAMTIISKNNGGTWRVLGKGTEDENMGVPGSYVTLSGDGSIAAVGTDSVIALYVISLNHDPDNTTTTTDGKPTPAADDTIDDTTNVPNATAANATFFEICAPFPNSTKDHVGDIDSLPKEEDQHTLTISMSGDASVVAVGIDSWAEENRGMTRVFAWDCSNAKYTKLGQDLFGTDDFDGFGQSVDLSSDGKTLVVGASQPPPGKSGYVDIYTFGEDGLWTLDERFKEVHTLVEDIGREIRISSDGSTVAIHGSFVDESDGGYLSSFIRIIEKTQGKWVNKGDDLMGSIAYDNYGSKVKLSFAADGTTLGVTGSYCNFMAKMYTFDSTKSNWTETIIPPVKHTEDADSESDYDFEMDEYCEEYFDGSDIALSNDGQSVAIAGLHWGTSSAIVRVLKLGEQGNWTMSHDAIDYDGAYTANSIGISGDAQVLAVGINVQDDDKEGQGALFVSQADDSDSGWSSLGKIDGRDEYDYLGSRVSVSSDGHLAAASSLKGYISFFKISTPS